MINFFCCEAFIPVADDAIFRWLHFAYGNPLNFNVSIAYSMKLQW